MSARSLESKRGGDNHTDNGDADVYPCGTVSKQFDAVDDTQLSLRKGDIIVITERSAEYWWWGTNEESQISGYFPKENLWFHTPWRKAHDATHKHDYFVNLMTGESVWDQPADFVEPDEIDDTDIPDRLDDNRIQGNKAPVRSKAPEIIVGTNVKAQKDAAVGFHNIRDQALKTFEQIIYGF